MTDLESPVKNRRKVKKNGIFPSLAAKEGIVSPNKSQKFPGADSEGCQDHSYLNGSSSNLSGNESIQHRDERNFRSTENDSGCQKPINSSQNPSKGKLYENNFDQEDEEERPKYGEDSSLTDYPDELTKAYCNRIEKLERQTSFSDTARSEDSTPIFTNNSSPIATRRLERLKDRELLVTMEEDRRLGTMSLKSSSSTSCLSSISTREARTKNFMVGSISSGLGSILGASELEKILPDRKVFVFVVTWNMAQPKSNTYPESLEDLLFPECMETVPDIYAICTQEGPVDKQEMLVRLQATIGPTHVLYEHIFHGTLAVCIFLRRELIWFVSIPEKEFVSTRTAIRTKGAVAINFMLFGTSFLFLSCHFKSDAGNYTLRIEDYTKIISSLDLPKLVIQNSKQKEEKDVTRRFDITFWSGDLNFRLENSREIVERVIEGIKSKDNHYYEELLKNDELLKARAEGLMFHDFDEGRINFPPTYKYDVDSDIFDTSELCRIPSYTDRILFRSKKKNSISCMVYNSFQELRYSDHRPVFGYFEVSVKPGRDNVPLSAGKFYHNIYTEGNRRRAKHLDTLSTNEKKTKSRMCSIQ